MLDIIGKLKLNSTQQLKFYTLLGKPNSFKTRHQYHSHSQRLPQHKHHRIHNPFQNEEFQALFFIAERFFCTPLIALGVPYDLMIKLNYFIPGHKTNQNEIPMMFHTSKSSCQCSKNGIKNKIKALFNQ